MFSIRNLFRQVARDGAQLCHRAGKNITRFIATYIIPACLAEDVIGVYHKAKLIPALRRALNLSLRPRVRDEYLLSLFLSRSVSEYLVHVHIFERGHRGTAPVVIRASCAFYLAPRLFASSCDCPARVPAFEIAPSSATPTPRGMSRALGSRFRGIPRGPISLRRGIEGHRRFASRQRR